MGTQSRWLARVHLEIGKGSYLSRNPLVGCKRGCPYCYARQQAKRQKHNCMWCYLFIPHLHEDRLIQPYNRKKPATIFGMSMGEVFGLWVQRGWVCKIFKPIVDNPHHLFIILTKFPLNAVAFNFPKNVIFGYSIDKISDYTLKNVEALKDTSARLKLICFEPLQGDCSIVPLNGIGWVIIGAQSQPKRRPKKEWVTNIMDNAREYDIPVFLKNNLRDLMGYNLIQEFPEAMYNAT